jgi:anti-sigma B factor antagonist
VAGRAPVPAAVGAIPPVIRRATCGCFIRVPSGYGPEGWLRPGAPTNERKQHVTAEPGRIRPQDLLRVTSHHFDDADDTVLLEASGEVDLHSASVLEEAVTAAVARTPALLVIDLTGVSFLASIGITVLLEARRVAGEGTQIRVVAGERGVVERTLQLTGVHETLGVVPSRADALIR